MALKHKTKIVFLGAGNLASSLAPALYSAGFEITQVYSRTKASAQKLASRFLCSYTTSLANIFPDADVYVICVKDDAIKKLAATLRLPGKLVVHTSGSTSLKELDKISSLTGVIYPLQSFTRTKTLSIKKIPVFIEGNNKKSLGLIKAIAGTISKSVIATDSAARFQLHLAAVFACNFTNHLYTIAEDLLKKKGLQFSYLYPLLLETTMRTETTSPLKLQTGPAIRDDKRTLRKQVKTLKEEENKEVVALYKLFTKMIRERHKKIKS